MPEPQHRRSESTTAVMLEDPALQNHNRQASFSDSDVFPPRSTNYSGTRVDLPYNPDGMIEFWLHEYEAVLNEVFGESEHHATGMGIGMGIHSVGMAERGDPAWNRLDEIMRGGRGVGVDDDEISDSESVVSVGELGQDARLGVGLTPSIAGSDTDSESESDFDIDIDTNDNMDEKPKQPTLLLPSPSDLKLEEKHQRDLARQQRRQSGNENTWEHMSPTTLSLLPRSPAERRRSSSSSDRGRDSPLRAITMGFNGVNGDPNTAVFDDEDLDIPGPMPITRGDDDDREDGGTEFGAVDEVEYAYGE